MEAALDHRGGDADKLMAWVRHQTWRYELGIKFGPYVGPFIFFNDRYGRACILASPSTVQLVQGRARKDGHVRLWGNLAKHVPELQGSTCGDWPAGRVDARSRGGPFVIHIDRRLNRRKFVAIVRREFELPSGVTVRVDSVRYRSQRNISCR